MLPGPKWDSVSVSSKPSNAWSPEYNDVTLIFSGGPCQGQLSGKSVQIFKKELFKCKRKLKLYFLKNLSEVILILSYQNQWVAKIWGCDEDLALWAAPAEPGSQAAQARAWLESRPRLGLSPSIHNTEIHITHSEPPLPMTTIIWSINHNKMTNRQMDNGWHPYKSPKETLKGKVWFYWQPFGQVSCFPNLEFNFSGITDSLDLEFRFRLFK